MFKMGWLKKSRLCEVGEKKQCKFQRQHEAHRWQLAICHEDNLGGQRITTTNDEQVMSGDEQRPSFIQRLCVQTTQAFGHRHIYEPVLDTIIHSLQVRRI